MALKYEELILPNYMNSEKVYANLTVSDCAIAAVLAKLNLMLVGDSGTGKSQLAKDIFNFYFKGNFSEGGQGIMVRAHPEIDIYNEIFSELNKTEARRVLKDDIKAMVYFVDELNRAPEVTQNQFLGLGDGMMDFQGRSFRLGREGYHLLIATANLGNSEFQGTFEADKAMYNRLHVTIDVDHEDYKPTRKDKLKLKQKIADPTVKEAPLRDISDKLIISSREIAELTRNPGMDALAAMYYLEFGLDNCIRYGRKGKIWPMGCHDCQHNNAADGSHALCSLVKSPVERTLQAILKYACALEYLAKIKNPHQALNSVDTIFKAFELTGAYQQLLNPTVLKTEYFDHNPALMKEVVDKLKKDFRSNEDFILCALEKAKNGKKITSFFTYDDNGQKKIGDWNKLGDKAKGSLKKIEPFTDEKREIGMGWVKDVIDFEMEQLKEAQKKEKKEAEDAKKASENASEENTDASEEKPKGKELVALHEKEK
ncbi:hypothetical protein HZA97_01150 [Candidatus Woesearchaeota archaeon]|nr:hypothetical protein [Candidatus Woesearchaeota archaeon]